MPTENNANTWPWNGDNDTIDAMRYAYGHFDQGGKDYTGFYPIQHECARGEPQLFDLPHFRFWVYRCGKCGKGMECKAEAKFSDVYNTGAAA